MHVHLAPKFISRGEFFCFYLHSSKFRQNLRANKLIMVLYLSVNAVFINFLFTNFPFIYI